MLSGAVAGAPVLLEGAEADEVQRRARARGGRHEQRAASPRPAAGVALPAGACPRVCVSPEAPVELGRRRFRIGPGASEAVSRRIHSLIPSFGPFTKLHVHAHTQRSSSISGAPPAAGAAAAGAAACGSSSSSGAGSSSSGSGCGAASYGSSACGSTTAWSGANSPSRSNAGHHAAAVGLLSSPSPFLTRQHSLPLVFERRAAYGGGAGCSRENSSGNGSGGSGSTSPARANAVAVAHQRYVPLCRADVHRRRNT